MDPKWLASKLREGGLIDEAALTAALQRGADDLCLELLRAGAVEESALLRFLGLQFQTRYITTEKLSQATIPQWVLDLVPVEVCEKLHVVPVRCDKQRTALSIVTPDPGSEELRRSLQQVTGAQKVQAHMALPHAIDAAIKKLYKGDIHAFARIDRLLATTYNAMLEAYDGRLIDLEGDQEEIALARPALPTGPALPSVTAPAAAEVAAQPAAAQPAAAQPAAAKPSAPPVAGSVGRPPAVGATGILPAAAALVDLIEVGHGWRRRHSAQVADLATAVAARLGLPADEIEHIRLAAALHEVGKPIEPHLTVLEIEDSPRALALARQVWRTPLKVLGGVGIPDGATRILSAVYERAGGDGVPGQARGDQIPRGARVLAAADLYIDLASNPKHGQSGLDRLPGALLTLFDERTAPTVHQHLLAEANRAERHRVLIIDEDSEAARALEIDLLRADYDVDALRTTAEAARSLLVKRFDLIISEVELRPVDGFDFLQRIGADARTQRIPLLFLSSRGDATDVQRGTELGAVGYLTKPYDPDGVLAKIRQAIGPGPT